MIAIQFGVIKSNSNDFATDRNLITNTTIFKNTQSFRSFIFGLKKCAFN